MTVFPISGSSKSIIFHFFILHKLRRVGTVNLAKCSSLKKLFVNRRIHVFAFVNEQIQGIAENSRSVSWAVLHSSSDPPEPRVLFCKQPVTEEAGVHKKQTDW